MIVRIDALRKLVGVLRQVVKWCMPALLFALAADALLAGDDPAPYVAGLLVIGWIGCRSSA